MLGSGSKLYCDDATATAIESDYSLLAFRGDASNMADRSDVRHFLDDVAQFEILENPDIEQLEENR